VTLAVMMKEKEDWYSSKPGDLVEVLFKFFVSELYEVNSVSQTAKISLFYTMYWRDDRVAERDYSVKDQDAWDAYCFKKQVDREKIWTPEIEIINCGGDDGELTQDAREIVNIPGKGQFVIMHMMYKGDIQLNLDMKEFPFDRMSIPIKFRSALYPASELVMKFDGDSLLDLNNLMPTCMDQRVEHPEFYIRCLQAYSIRHVYPMIAELEGENHATYCEFRIELFLERKFGFCLNKVWIPFTFILIMDLCCYLLLQSDISNRNNIGLTLFLTAVALKFAVSDNLPKISYQTRMDKYILCIYGIMATIYVQNYVVYRFYGLENLEIESVLDDKLSSLQKGFIAFIMAVIGIINVWFLYPLLHVGKPSKEVKVFKA
jgi:hypothetical protein